MNSVALELARLVMELPIHTGRDQSQQRVENLGHPGNRDSRRTPDVRQYPVPFPTPVKQDTIRNTVDEASKESFPGCDALSGTQPNIEDGNMPCHPEIGILELSMPTDTSAIPG